MGPNSPVIWENRVFLTGASSKKREVYCYDSITGKMLWQKAMPDIPNVHPGDLTVSEDTGGYSVSTGATDGRRFYVMFANGDVGALDFDGNVLWTVSLGTPENSYGHSTSLDTFQDRVLVLFDQAEAKSAKSRLLCLDGATGKKVWESEPRPVGQTWGTPILVKTPEREQIITCGNPWVVSYNPTNGLEIWRAKALYGEVTPSPISANGMVYVAMDGEALSAWKTDGAGDVTKTHKAWSFDEGLPDICTPLCDGQRIYMLNSSGTLTVVDVVTGKKLYEQEFDFPYKASPSAAGDKIYLCGDKGMVVVFEAGAKYKEIARSDMGEELLASPAFADGRIYIRGKQNLFCLGKAK
jgi:outer membrane protein assembly factor BamB